MFSHQNTLSHLNPLQGPGIYSFKTIFEGQLCAKANYNTTQEVLALLEIISGHAKSFKGNKQAFGLQSEWQEWEEWDGEWERERH